MINSIALPWYANTQKTRWTAYTIYGRVELKTALEPWNLMTFGFDEPRRGWAILFNGKKIGWTIDLKDAGHFAANHILYTANQGRKAQ